MASCLLWGKDGSVESLDSIGSKWSYFQASCNNKSIGQIYTDWANHYLEKAKFKRYIQDLQVDVTDGVLLADVIEAVTSERVKDIIRRPKSSGQMIDNIKLSLILLTKLGVNIDGITAKDIRDGNLKSILGLFFSLSRHKQQQKSYSANNKSNSSGLTAPSSVSMGRSVETSSRLPAPRQQSTPARGLSSNKDSVSNIVSSPASSVSPAVIKTGNTSVKSALNQHPPRGLQQSSGIPIPGSIPKPNPSSFIPQPRSGSSKADNKVLNRATSSRTSSQTSLSAPTQQPAVNASNAGKNSMLDKFKFFKDKDKAKASSKRTSSSSGFSSARSERSDSSTSLCSEAKVGGTPTGTSASSTTSTSPDHNESSTSISSSAATSTTSTTSSPKLAIKALARKTFGKSGTDRKNGDKQNAIGVKSTSVENKKLYHQKDSRLKSETVLQKPTVVKLEGQINSSSSRTDSPIIEESASIPKSDSPVENKLPTSRLTKNYLSSDKTQAQNLIGPNEASKTVEPKASSLTPPKVNSNSGIIKSSNSKDNIVSCGSETNVTMQSSQNSQIMTNSGSGIGSAIPKPTAAVKGTTKVLKEEKMTKVSPSPLPKVTSPQVESHQFNETNNKTEMMSLRDMEKNRTQAGSGNRSGTLPKAMVSPMMSTKNIRVNSSTNESDEINKMRNQSSLPKNKIETTFDTTDKVITQEITLRRPANRDNEEYEDISVNIKPMQPISRSSHYGYFTGQMIGGFTGSSRNLAPSVHIPAYRLQQSETAAMTAGRLTAGNHMKMNPNIKRTLNESSGLLDDLSDVDSVDASNGYMSDGDTLRNNTFYTADINSGYMSEGGASLYARSNRMTSAIKLRESLNGFKIGPSIGNDDRSVANTRIASSNKHCFDDSSSLSSGISDTIAEFGEDITGDHHLYGNIRRHPSKDGKFNVAVAAKKGTAHYNLKSGKTSKPKQKSDSSMQTDSSAFRQLAYKKLECKALDDKVDLRRGKSDLTSAVLHGAKERTDDGDRAPGSPRSRRKKPDELACGSKMKSDDPDKRHRSEQGKKSSRNCSSATSQVKKSSVNGGIVKIKCQDADANTNATLTAQVSGVQRPEKTISVDKRGKVKVCGSTQTSTHDLHNSGSVNSSVSGSSQLVHSDGEYSLGRKHKHFAMPNSSSSLRNQSPTQNISQSGGSEYHRGQRLSISSDQSSPYSVPYSTVTSNPVAGSSSHYAWLRGREAAANVSGASRTHYTPIGGSLTETESMESLSSASNSLHAQLQHVRANSLTHARLLLHQRELAASSTPGGGSPRLSRSNSIRSTKSEKMYPSMLTRSEDIDNLLLSSATSVTGAPGHHVGGNNTSQPTSPSSQPVGLLFPDVLFLHGTGRFTFPLSSNAAVSSNSGHHNTSHRSSSGSPYMSGVLSKIHSKDEDLHGSALSLASTASSIYTTPEEKHAHEIRKLRRELEQAHDKVHTLTSHLNTNSHVVAAFEQSLSNMTSRLQHLTATAEQKDSELNELRNTIESLRNKSVEAGLVSSKYLTGTSVNSVISASPHITRRHTFNNNGVDNGFKDGRLLSRQLSTDSVSSLSSACSLNSSASKQSCDLSNKKKKKGWLRSSFSKAFSRSKKNRNGSVSDVEDINMLHSDTSTPNSPLLASPHQNVPYNQRLMSNSNLSNNVKISQSSSAIYDNDEEIAPEAIQELKKQLREKDMVLTDIRLDALTSAHQLESLKDTVNKMRSEMLSLKEDNVRLQRLVTSKSLASSRSSLHRLTNDNRNNSVEYLEKKLSSSEHSALSSRDMLLIDGRSDMIDEDSTRVTISVHLGFHGDRNKILASSQTENEVLISNISISNKTKWEALDNIIRRAFKEYVLRVDPASNLGLNAESVLSYTIGDITRCKESDIPELLPCGYLVGDNTQINILLRGTCQNSVDALAFEMLIPKTIIHRYVSLLTEHRRIILCGPSGTGKTYLAQKLGEFLVLRSGKELTPGSIATFCVDHKSAKELRQYLSNVAEQCENNAADLPSVIILDNLHHVGSLAEVFNGFLNTKYLKCPYIIGTMNQATCSTTNLQLHHNFRWVLCANHMEPVKGFLGRYLRKKLVEHEVKNGTKNGLLNKIVDWMPKVWQQLNKFLETHSSSDVTIGPRLFLSCPVDVDSSQVWFTDLWNYSIVPYLLEAVREGLQLYGRRAAWEDPADWVLESYPWPNTPQEGSDWPPQLLKLRPEDVGYDNSQNGIPNSPGGSIRSSVGKTGSSGQQSDTDGDPLLNMLMRLQEAASYSSPHGNATKDDPKSEELLSNAGLESTL